MRALLIEKYSSGTYPFIEGLHETTQCCVRHDQTVEEGIRTMEQSHCDLILVTMDEQLPPAWKVADRIQSHANEMLGRSPYLIFLFDKRIPIPDALKCRDMGAICMRRDFPQPVYEEARLAFWRFAARRHDTTILVAFRGGHHSIYIGLSRTHVSLGAKLTRMAVILLGGNESYPLEFIADEMGICRQSVKKYFFELRRAFNGIFWIERRPGGTVCGVKANVVWL